MLQLALVHSAQAGKHGTRKVCGMCCRAQVRYAERAVGHKVANDIKDTVGASEEASVTNLDNNQAEYTANGDTDTSAVRETRPCCVRKKSAILLGKCKECASRIGTVENGGGED